MNNNGKFLLVAPSSGGGGNIVILSGEGDYNAATLTYSVEGKIDSAYIVGNGTHYTDQWHQLKDLSEGIHSFNFGHTVNCDENVKFEIAYTSNGKQSLSNSINVYIMYCFPAGTKVIIDNEGNTKNIEDVKLFDNVLSYDFQTNRNILVPVDNTFKSCPGNYITITFSDDSTLSCHSGHAIYTTEGWKSVSPHLLMTGDYSNKLSVNDSVLCFDNNSLTNIYKTVKSISEPSEEKINMYSLDIESPYISFYADSVLAYETPLDKTSSYGGVGKETQVLMADGETKPISEVNVGDYVMALNRETQETEPAIVKNTYNLNSTFDVIKLTLTDNNNNDSELIVCPRQAIYTTDGWKTIIGETNIEHSLTNVLSIGDTIIKKDDDNSFVSVKNIEMMSIQGKDIYELNVDDNYDTYYVTMGGKIRNLPQYVNRMIMLHNTFTSPCN